MLRVIGLLLLIPLLDILVLVALATRIGAVATVALVVLTALVGLLLVRAEGRHTLRKIQEKLTRGEVPDDEVVDGGLLVASGAFLLTPGIVTDLVGLLLVLPPTRYSIRLAVKKFVVTPYVDAKTGGIYTGGVYTAGFPRDDPDDYDTYDNDTYDMGDDEYSVDRGSGSDN
ncbi:FxsA family protein [Halomarina pelagica]|uniref:FxsA family protein n=1 Tax=Halomarina pelagica TaxID=2961599 RepID=UPI0020C4D109|nr:FxsA family protein [Halomarina sp. BND7]